MLGHIFGYIQRGDLMASKENAKENLNKALNKASKPKKSKNKTKKEKTPDEMMVAKNHSIDCLFEILGYDGKVAPPPVLFKKMNDVAKVEISEEETYYDYIMFDRALTLAYPAIIRAIRKRDFDGPVHKIVYILEIVKNYIAEAHLEIENEKMFERIRVAQEEAQNSNDDFYIPKRTPQEMAKEKEAHQKKLERIARLEQALKDHGCE